nr:hypothetical protein [Pseudomonas sp. BSw22131]
MNICCAFCPGFRHALGANLSVRISRDRELDPDVFGEELLEPGYQRVDRIAAVELIVTQRG